MALQRARSDQRKECRAPHSAVDVSDQRSGENETTPLVFDGMMYVTGPSNSAWALDAITGRPIWSYKKTPPPDLSLCCGQVNRGFARRGNTLFKVDLQG